MEHKAFTVKASGNFREIRTPIGIFSVAPGPMKIPTKIEVFQGIWDTGATNTAISSTVVQKLNLTPITFAPVGTGGGQVNAPVYLLNIVLPNNVIMPSIQVTELPGLKNCDVLIGMDIICRGDFAVTHANGEACCSFRIPTHTQIDFVPESEHHNKLMQNGGNPGTNQSKKNLPKKKPRKKTRK
jgi:hypothetical protein